jgi:hypothetical protein
MKLQFALLGNTEHKEVLRFRIIVNEVLLFILVPLFCTLYSSLYLFLFLFYGDAYQRHLPSNLLSFHFLDIFMIICYEILLYKPENFNTVMDLLRLKHL